MTGPALLCPGVEIEAISAVDENWTVDLVGRPFRVDSAIVVPLGEQENDVRSFEGVIYVLDEGETRCGLSCVSQRLGIVDVDDRSQVVESASNVECR
jgi:hypothetical protein